VSQVASMRISVKESNERIEALSIDLRAEKERHLTTLQSYRLMQDKLIQDEEYVHANASVYGLEILLLLCMSCCNNCCCVVVESVFFISKSCA